MNGTDTRHKSVVVDWSSYEQIFKSFGFALDFPV